MVLSVSTIVIFSGVVVPATVFDHKGRPLSHRNLLESLGLAQRGRLETDLVRMIEPLAPLREVCEEGGR